MWGKLKAWPEFVVAMWWCESCWRECNVRREKRDNNEGKGEMNDEERRKKETKEFGSVWHAAMRS